jgi:hypothetical protein
MTSSPRGARRPDRESPFVPFDDDGLPAMQQGGQHVLRDSSAHEREIASEKTPRLRRCELDHAVTAAEDDVPGIAGLALLE